MTFESVLLNDVMVNRWSGSADVKDVEEAFEAAKRACGSIGGPITNIAVMAKDAKFPQVAAVQRMARDHAKMLEFHRSVHYLVLAEGFVASRIMMFISSDLIRGTRGKMQLNKTAKDALEQARSFGPLRAQEEAIYRQLKLYGVSDEKLGR